MNVWEQLAEKQISSPRKARMRAVETRAQRKREKELQDRGILFKMWLKWHEERKAMLLAGAWGGAARELADLLERMTLDDAPALLAHVKAGPWREADRDTRFLTLAMIDHRIIYIREQAGLVPMDDSLPWIGEEPTVFEQIKELLT